MKRWIVLLLAVVLVLSLAACGGKAENPAEEPQDVPSETQDGGEASEDGSEQPEDTVMTKEDMLEQALEVDSATIHRDSLENLAKAKDLYCSKILLLEGTVLEIQEDCAVLQGYTNCTKRYKI